MRSVTVVAPTSLLGGRRFEPQAELTLHEFARIAAATLPGVADEVLLVPEMPSPLGLPDFIALSDGRSWLEARQAAGVQPILSEAECSVLAVLHPGQALSRETVARRSAWSVAALDPVVTRLANAGAIESTPRGALRVNPSLVPSGSMFALEAKVKDWQKAVLQGRAYRTWANNYVVVLGAVGPVAERRAAERIRDDGAGLFTSSGWIARPRVRRPALAKRLWGFEHLYAALASSGPAF